jgi:hypothetical protein
MTQIYYKILLNEVEQTGTLDLEDTHLSAVNDAIQSQFPGAGLSHYHIIGDGCLCGEGQ